MNATVRTKLAASLMLLAVLLAGSDCQDSSATTNRVNQGGEASRSADRSGRDNFEDRDSLEDRDNLDELYERGSYTPGDTADDGSNLGGNTQIPNEDLQGQTGSNGACVSDRGCGASQDCVADTCVESGPLRITLYWSERTDIDLHILTPTGEKLWYRNRNTNDGGEFASDSCIGGTCIPGSAVLETAHWANEPTRGYYEVWATNYAGEMAVSAKFEILIDGVISSYTTTVPAARGAESQSIRIRYPSVEGEEELDAGTLLGAFVHTYYYLAEEVNYTGSADTTLYDSQCRPLARVSAKFADSACIEGSGKLRDGTIINYAKTCNCGRRCPTGGTVCYSKLDAARFPWGKGNRNNPLDPFRSIAVDRNVIANGTVLYMEKWDGVAIPSISGIGGFVHDGCFRADDVGGAIRGNHYDFFAGTKDVWRALERIRPTRTSTKVYTNSERCAHLR